jgi:hypothetical protein
MGLVAYRDIGDDYVTRTFDLTIDIQAAATGRKASTKHSTSRTNSTSR